MEAVIIVVVALAISIGYRFWVTSGVKPRVVQTSATDQQLANVFNEAVVGRTWKIVDDGNPMVAQSPLVTGVRQQIAMQIDPGSGPRTVTVQPIRVVTKIYGMPTKAHTLRMRLNSFTKRVQAVDPSATVTKG